LFEFVLSESSTAKPFDLKVNIQDLFQLLSQAKQCDVARLKSRVLSLKKNLTKRQPESSIKQEKIFAQIKQAIEKSIHDKQQKLNNLPKINYPDDLPIAQSAERIAKAIKENQVVIIAVKQDQVKQHKFLRYVLS